jgi:6-phosphogluconolactonase
MKQAAAALAFLSIAAFAPGAGQAAAAAGGTLMVYVGTYTGGTSASKGIYRLRLDLATGALTEAGPPAESVNPSFLALHPGGRYL